MTGRNGRMHGLGTALRLGGLETRVWRTPVWRKRYSWAPYESGVLAGVLSRLGAPDLASEMKRGDEY